MKIEQLIQPDRIARDVHTSSKKRALEQLSALIARSVPELTEEEVFDSLIGREKLGSTGLGHGVGLPHGRMKGRRHAIGAFVKLDHGVDYDAIDDQPVDLLFALLVPEESTDEHLQILSELAEMFANEQFCEKLRHSQNEGQIFDLLIHWYSDRKSAPA
ncbi:MAG: PTS IIA-like nitrogen regulatory protein PtsN [Gammaproteobacteria bacterium]|nr:PTS IIA-like nitrogen regulatory protein PtsN [Gammaproteobacteria bacterium]NIR98807.1 PTS IIA-like nitrogen regulatory protein PtsN [Gammaproteobacteria bacterium]NIT64517.1 PTS IIA-like nitrogen regulatory protein PtsN [Gammaproteobacteria bacterium]NIV21437.1 PTS IIA-like nitrogen regulatory protein PtsN [Gammaproteobacteria bacterium]NIX11307.1 PTS IIA-like nitrogen regulatory protein PtsN [Gammaproteobacteria bacterium]